LEDGKGESHGLSFRLVVGAEAVKAAIHAAPAAADECSALVKSGLHPIPLAFLPKMGYFIGETRPKRAPCRQFWASFK
jgi:hypothetical protein